MSRWAIVRSIPPRHGRPPVRRCCGLLLDARVDRSDAREPERAGGRLIEVVVTAIHVGPAVVDGRGHRPPAAAQAHARAARQATGWRPRRWRGSRMRWSRRPRTRRRRPAHRPTSIPAPAVARPLARSPAKHDAQRAVGRRRRAEANGEAAAQPGAPAGDRAPRVAAPPLDGDGPPAASGQQPARHRHVVSGDHAAGAMSDAHRGLHLDLGDPRDRRTAACPRAPMAPRRPAAVAVGADAPVSETARSTAECRGRVRSV